jgi:hypothetical protein
MNNLNRGRSANWYDKPVADATVQQRLSELKRQMLSAQVFLDDNNLDAFAGALRRIASMAIDLNNRVINTIDPNLTSCLRRI